MKPTPVNQVKDLLASIARNQTELDRAKADLDDQIRPYVNLYGRAINELSAKIATEEKQLEKLVKKHRKAVMAGHDRVDLKTGTVFLKEHRVVKRIRKMLENLKAAGLRQLIKTAESVDWDAVEKLDDADLKKLETQRQPKLIFSYELRNVGSNNG